jgi:hypothetical protein
MMAKRTRGVSSEVVKEEGVHLVLWRGSNNSNSNNCKPCFVVSRGCRWAASLILEDAHNLMTTLTPTKESSSFFQIIEKSSTRPPHKTRNNSSRRNNESKKIRYRTSVVPANRKRNEASQQSTTPFSG